MSLSETLLQFDKVRPGIAFEDIEPLRCPKSKGNRAVLAAISVAEATSVDGPLAVIPVDFGNWRQADIDRDA